MHPIPTGDFPARPGRRHELRFGSSGLSLVAAQEPPGSEACRGELPMDKLMLPMDELMDTEGAAQSLPSGGHETRGLFLWK